MPSSCLRISCNEWKSCGWVEKQSRDRSYFDIQCGGIRICVEFGTGSEYFWRWPMPSCLQWFASDIETGKCNIVKRNPPLGRDLIQLPVHRNFYIVFEPKHHVNFVPGRSWQWARQRDSSALHGKLVDRFDCKKDLKSVYFKQLLKTLNN